MTKILILILISISGTIYSQNERPLHVLLEVLSENHMGSVTDVFTLEELQIIKNYYSETNMFIEEDRVLLNRRYSSSENIATPINVVDINPLELNAVEILATTPMTAFPGAGANLRNLGPPRVLVIDNDGNAWRRDPGINPGTITNLGAISGIPPGHSITGIEVVSGPTGQLFGMSTNGVDDSRLLQIDPNNLTATVIGNNNGLVIPIALARDADNNLITADIDDDKVYGVDKVSGVVTEIGPLGYDANFGQAMCYDQFSDKVVNIAYNPAFGDSQMRYIDPGTGASTVIGNIEPGTVQQFGWASTYDRDEVLGVTNNSIHGFSFYPNPTQDNINLSANNTIDHIEVFSILGQSVIKQSTDSNSIHLDLSTLQSGNYILKVISGNQIGSYKLIKQ